MALGRPAGSRNRRTEELFTRLENRGDVDPGDLLSSIVTNPIEAEELRVEAAALLMLQSRNCPGKTRESPCPISSIAMAQSAKSVSYL